MNNASHTSRRAEWLLTLTPSERDRLNEIEIGLTARAVEVGAEINWQQIEEKAAMRFMEQYSHAGVRGRNKW